MSPTQGWFESDEDYRDRVAREADERTIEETTGSAPSQGWFESDEDYQCRVASQANECRIKETTGTAPSQGFFESDDDYRRRVAREAKGTSMFGIDMLREMRNLHQELFAGTPGSVEQPCLHRHTEFLPIGTERELNFDRAGRVVVGLDNLEQVETIPLRSEGEVPSNIVLYSPSVRLLKDLHLRRTALHDLSPRELERLVASLLEEDGYRVRLGPGTKDGGVDVYAEKMLPNIGLISTVWQAKQIRPFNKVGVAIIRELADTTRVMNASKGILVTSSFLTRGALQRIERDQFFLGKVDHDDLVEWIDRIAEGPSNNS